MIIISLPAPCLVWDPRRFGGLDFCSEDSSQPLMSFASLAPPWNKKSWVFVGHIWTESRSTARDALWQTVGAFFEHRQRRPCTDNWKIKQFGWILAYMHMPPVSINPFVALHPSAGVAMRVSFDLIWRCWRSTVRYSWTSLSPQPLDLTLASKSLLGRRITPCVQEDWQRLRTLASLWTINKQIQAYLRLETNLWVICVSVMD